LAAHRHNVNVLLSDRTFFDFCSFSCAMYVAVTDCFKLEVFLTSIFAVILHVLLFAVDVDYIGLAFRLKHVN